MKDECYAIMTDFQHVTKLYNEDVYSISLLHAIHATDFYRARPSRPHHTVRGIVHFVRRMTGTVRLSYG